VHAHTASQRPGPVFTISATTFLIVAKSNLHLPPSDIHAFKEEGDVFQEKTTKECMNAKGLTNYEASNLIHKGDAFGDFWKINYRSDSLGLNLVYDELLLGDADWRPCTEEPLSATTHIGLH
jgi:hypothetical protein